MAYAILSWLQNLWPFSICKTDGDLKASDGLVHGLSIPDQTKQFVFAVRDPETHAVIYLLAAQNLSEQSALDAEYLIKEVQPEAVVVQIAPSALSQIQAEENDLSDDKEEIPIPTSAFGVLKRCFINKTGRQQYENIAGGQVLRDIFGVGFYGHFLSAKGAAKEVNATFLCLESSCVTTCVDSREEAVIGNSDTAHVLQLSNLLPGKLYRCQMIEKEDLLILFKDSIQKNVTQAIGKALVYAQKMLTDVDKGDPVDAKLLSEVHNFRIAVEGLRIALNDVARSPVNKMESAHSSNIEFPELSHEDKSHVLLVHALKSQTKKFKSIVAIVDASSLGGLRKHWNTPVPQDIAELDEQYFTSFENDGEAVTWWRKKMLEILLADKPVVAVGAGASAMLGASSLSKVVPMSTFMKLVTYKIPTFVKIGLVQTQRTAALALTKVLGPSKMVVPGLASSGVKTSALKVAASTEKIRVVAHSVIASVERTSFQIMRTTFYEIMRRRRGRPIGFTPWTAFGCSVTTCAGLLVYGDGIECAAESAPAAPRIACLGRGLKSLHQASQEVRQTNNAKIHEAIKSLMYSVKKIKHQ
ncbi:hypothetical protein MRB53_004375 [Persea americana]|uniref:Uncharacterized protein n=1 Tax=Persea americana TaxID=3435 RepID=A0ACC2MA17_PERAE|nr:hypothetical protein MRB53_004375 [Persea americana]